MVEADRIALSSRRLQRHVSTSFTKPPYLIAYMVGLLTLLNAKWSDFEPVTHLPNAVRFYRWKHIHYQKLNCVDGFEPSAYALFLFYGVLYHYRVHWSTSELHAKYITVLSESYSWIVHWPRPSRVYTICSIRPTADKGKMVQNTRIELVYETWQVSILPLN